jgi:malonyl CoA-acyl carrier protein transacylase
MKAHLFPGQGSQRIGMGEALFDAFPDLTRSADAILGYSIKELCLKDPGRNLAKTEFTQPALYVVNALTYRQRAKDPDWRADFAAGHSLGEYNALECAGVFSFDDGLKLVKRRGELMCTAPTGAMAAILGLASEEIAGILAENGLATIDVANYNAATQTIISGLEQDIRNAQRCFEEHKAMYIPLNAGGAFHSRYMRPVVGEFETFLRGFDFAPPQVPVIANVSARPYEPGQVVHNLLEQLASPVRWLDSMNYLLQQGVTDFAELGPGDVLTKLIRGIKSQFKPSTIVAPVANASVAPQTSGTLRQSVPPTPVNAQQRAADWNRSHSIGTAVKVKGYQQTFTTKTNAVVLFGHRAAIYMQGYNGYFALDDVEPTSRAASAM